MTGFELGISGVGGDHFTNCATNTAYVSNVLSINFDVKHRINYDELARRRK